MRQLPRVNYEIREPRIKLIDENGTMLGEFDVREARRIAFDKGFDLVEVAPNSRPPVCKLLDFGRYMYEKKRQERESRRHQHRTEVREMRISLRISDHDYQVKLAKVKEFLTDGDRVKISLRLRGREMIHSDLGMKVFERLIVDLDSLAKPEAAPIKEENTIFTTFFPDKKKKKEETR